MLWYWIISVFRWLWARKIFCVAVLLLVVAIFSSWKMALPDKTFADRLRYTGLALELFGIFTVAYGLYETLKTFGRSLRSIISEPIKGFPKFGEPRTIVGSMNAIEESPDSCYATGTVSPSPNRLIENRVADLEEQLKQVLKDRTHFENEFKKLTDALNAERSEREASVERVRKMLEKFAVEGLAIEVLGVVCLVFGAIFATASSELAYFFDGFPVLLITLNSE
jgi:hypothetical protein